MGGISAHPSYGTNFCYGHMRIIPSEIFDFVNVFVSGRCYGTARLRCIEQCVSLSFFNFVYHAVDGAYIGTLITPCCDEIMVDISCCNVVAIHCHNKEPNVFIAERKIAGIHFRHEIRLTMVKLLRSQ